ncbi:13013_t:CDS:2 [Dentiscutata heterogama]|uniref:13013_t:CDS:1 n=1 Tax=Dentiscutata heterogama TaxID=1316150 RepID=A0ACA9M8R3_9GLOM|nr:13013_t:CDS:2 [Dentiscutata heterogama]
MVGDHDKYIGLALAVSSSLLIGTSFIITKKGLIDSTRRHGSSSEDHSYLRNPIWWIGMSTMVIGELLNFAAYSFAPAILVTPLGALSVLIGAVLASLFLKENLGRIGTVGCGLCLIGSINIVIHAPADRDIVTVDEILAFALQPGRSFSIYCVLVAVYTVFAIQRVVPKYGKKNPLVYLSICSLVGSISVMSCKGFGIALKLTFAGNNQFTHPSTYVFIIISGLCILVQMNYFNKALDQFETNIVNPIYYVFFTTSTIFASVLLFQGFNTSNAVNVISLFCGFLTIFAGVFLLNVAKTDGLLNRSSQNGNGVLRPSISLDMKTRDSTLLNAFNEESLGLTQLNDISDSEEG